MFILMFVGIFLTVCIVIFASHKKEKREICEKRKQINNKILADFRTDKYCIFYISGYADFNEENEYKQVIISDSIDKKLMFIDYKNQTLIKIDYGEFLDYEIYENGNTYSSGSGIGLGGGLFGIGVAGYDSTTDIKIKHLKLIIRTKNYQNSHVVYDLIEGTLFNMGVSKSDEQYEQCINSVQKVVSLFEVIKAENKKDLK